MWKKLIFGVLIAEIVVSWPLSLINKQAKIKAETIFYPETEEETMENYEVQGVEEIK